MAINEETIRLVLELTGSSSIKDATDKLEEFRKVGVKVSETYELMAQAGEGYVVENSRIQDQLEKRREETVANAKKTAQAEIEAAYFKQQQIEKTAREAAEAEVQIARLKQRASEDAAQKEMDAFVHAAVEKTRAQKIMNQTIDEHTAAQKKTVAAGADYEKFAKKLNVSIMSTSYAFQDFTSQLDTRGFAGALSSIQNNVPGMLSAFELSTKMVAGISVGAVGMGLLLPAIESFFQTLGDSSEAVETEAVAMDKLAKATKLTREETEKLDKYKKIQAEAAKIAAAQSKEELETQEGFREFFALAETMPPDALPGAKKPSIQAAIAGALAVTGRGEQMTQAEILAASDETRANNVSMARIAASRAGRALSPEEEKEVRVQAQQEQQAAKKAAQDRINEKNLASAFTLMGRAPTELGARQTIRALAGQVPGAFGELGPSFVSDFESMEPKAMEIQDLLNKDFDDELRDRAARVNARNIRQKQKDVTDKESHAAQLENDRLQAAIRKREETDRKKADRRAFLHEAAAHRAEVPSGVPGGEGGELARRRFQNKTKDRQGKKDIQVAERLADLADQFAASEARKAEINARIANSLGMMSDSDLKNFQTNLDLQAVERQQNGIQRDMQQAKNVGVGQQ